MLAVEQLKSQYTDKYVKVDGSRPELARFRNLVGQVKTVNMNGRALVEFLDYHLNIGWYDIDLGYLTVVPKPTDEELAAAKAAKAKPSPASGVKPDGKAAPTTGAKQTADAANPAVAGTKAGGAPKMSVAEMLAAARGGAKGAGAAPAAPAKPKAPPAAKGPAAPAAKPASRNMSVAEMLAAARASAGGAAAPAADEVAEAPAAAPPPRAAAKAPAAKAPAAKAPAGRVDRSAMSVAEMIAYCREHDAA